MRREDRIKLELHRMVVDHFRADPQRVREIARKNLEKQRYRYNRFTGGRGGLIWVDEWDALINGSDQGFIEMCLREDEHGNDMRQMGPFVGVLSQEERLTAIARARSYDGIST